MCVYLCAYEPNVDKGEKKVVTGGQGILYSLANTINNAHLGRKHGCQ